MNSVEKAKKILSSNEYLKDFAEQNTMTAAAAKVFLERILREPTVSKEVEKFVFSNETSSEIKSYYSGEEKGYQRGHEAGFAKGAAIGLLGGALGVAAAGFAVLKKD